MRYAFLHHARRILSSIPVLIFASLITFWLIRVTVDPLAKFRRLKDSALVIPKQKRLLGLDHPLVVQWWKWLTRLRARRLRHEQPHERSVCRR